MNVYQPPPSTSPPPPRSIALIALGVFLLLLGNAALSGPAAAQGTDQRPGDLSLEDLLNLTVSSAAKYAQKSADAPASITIITAEEIQRYGFRNLAEALQTLSSFSIATDHSYTYTGVRGFARPADYNNRVLVLVDGHVKNEAIIGAGEMGSLRMLDISDISRVEVVRGPGSALYGAHAMLAVLNVITKSGEEIDGTRAWAETGSFGNRGYGLQYGRRYRSGLNLAASAGLAEADGEDLYFPEFDSPGTAGGVAAGLNWGEVRRARAALEYDGLKLWGVAYSRARGVPTAPFRSIFGDPGAETDDNRWMVELQYGWDFEPGLSLTVKSYADHFETIHLYPHVSDNLIKMAMRATWVGSEARLHWDVRPNHRLVLGTEYFWAPAATIDMTDDLGIAGFEGDYPYHIGSVFVQDEFQFTRNTAVTLGLRHDQFSTGGGSTNPRFALVYHPWATGTIKALWGTAFRSPNIYEMNFESPYAIHLGNARLKSEEIRTAEFVLEQRLTRGLAARLGIFRNDFRHLVDQHPVAWPADWPPSDTGSPYVLQFQNGEMIRGEGLEVELNAAFPSGTLGYVRYGLQRVEEKSTGAPAPNYPAHSLKVGGTAWVGDLLSLGGNFLWESDRRTLAGPETKAYSVLDLTATSAPVFDHLTFSVSAKNVLDTEYALPSGPQHSLISIPQASRTLLFRLGASW